MFDDLLHFVQSDGRVCPQPRRWNEVWEMLPGRHRVGLGWEPPLPLILAAWWTTSVDQKRERFLLHLRVAHEREVLGRVNSFLRGLPEDEWVYERDL